MFCKNFKNIVRLFRGKFFVEVVTGNYGERSDVWSLMIDEGVVELYRV